ncbi:hypothetical protein [Niveibacterium sp.]|uniref:hypothetical protein n=1 Tax=Niveibacterium sp. TaxID=2017444 RepID=UPI0035AF3F3A
MKQKLIAALVTSAIAGLAAPTANAGVIQATYKIFAAEIFGDSALSLKAPVISYNLSRPVSGSSTNPNTFKIALTLSGGKWNAVGIANARAVLRDPSSANALPNTIAGAVLSNDDKTVTFTFVADQDNTTYPVNSTITFGDFSPEAPASAAAAAVSPDPSLFTLAVDSVLKTPLDAACAPEQASISVTAKMTNASDVEVDTNDPGAIITTPVLASNVALNITASSSASFGPAVTDNEVSKIDVLTTGLGKIFTSTASIPSTQAADDVTVALDKTINLGKITIKDRASLFDTNGLAKYTMAGVFGVDAVGNVSGDKLNAVISGKFVKNGTVFFSTNANCVGGAFAAGGTATLSSGLDTATFSTTIADAEWPTVGATTRGAYVCYTVPGTQVIPTSQFKLASGSLTKLGSSKELANPVCPANMYNLVSNGVQLDVRNYIQKAQTDATGWVSVLRIINTDESQTVDVNAQLIKDDGTLLNAGKIVTLAPRAFKYMTAAEIEALLPETVAASDNNARLRLTAAGSSLRVQNYHLNPVTGAVNEVSAAQGDDGPDYARKADGDNK